MRTCGTNMLTSMITLEKSETTMLNSGTTMLNSGTPLMNSGENFNKRAKKSPERKLQEFRVSNIVGNNNIIDTLENV